jgi:hypothetical protein
VRKVLSSFLNPPRPFPIRKNGERLRGRNVGVLKDALNLRVIDPRLVQPCAETTAKAMPAEPPSVDVLRNVSPG